MKVELNHIHRGQHLTYRGVYRGAVAIDFLNERSGKINVIDSNRCVLAAPVFETSNKWTNSSSEEDGVLPNTSDDSMENATNVQNLVPLFRQEEKQYKELNVGHVNNSHANNEQILYQQFLDCRL